MIIKSDKLALGAILNGKQGMQVHWHDKIMASKGVGAPVHRSDPINN